ncbi:MAG: cation transporter, partial [Sutterella sp.]|nr:cation transporter [Sutterella sp.]
MKNKQLTKETTLKGYARHDEGDSLYLHATGRVKTDVFGVAVFLTLGFAFVELIGGLWGNS